MACKRVIGLLVFVCIGVTGCSPAPAVDPCAPHGELHGDHCDCDRGFRDEGLRCVARADASPTDASLADAGIVIDAPLPEGCGPHGEQHGDHCHCDPGYVEVGGRCVPPAACARPDDVLEENDTPATASTWTLGAPAETLHLCPSDDDWFALPLTAGQSLHVDVRFAHAEADVDVYLFAPGADPAHERPVAGSDSTSDDEHFDFVAEAEGIHLLLVRAHDRREAAYQLAIE
jgi:hypothetical protein